MKNFHLNEQAVLITGASGFLGTYLSKACVDAGYQIYGIDHNLPTNLELWTGFVKKSVSEVDLGEFLQGVKLSACFHLAGSASVAYSVQNPFADFDRLLPGTAKLLEYIAQRQIQCHFILFSSAAIYGSPRTLPICESEPPAPISPYGVHKYLAENLLQNYSSLYGITGSILRIFSAYGAGLTKQLFWDVTHKYFEAFKKSEQSVTLFGTGDESRDFIHGSDIAKAALLVNTNSQHQKVQSVNIANGYEINIREAVYTLFKSCPEALTVNFNNQVRLGDPLRWCADISKLKAMNYTPSINLNQGLSDYFAWYKKMLNSEPNN